MQVVDLWVDDVLVSALSLRLRIQNFFEELFLKVFRFRSGFRQQDGLIDLLDVSWTRFEEVLRPQVDVRAGMVRPSNVILQSVGLEGEVSLTGAVSHQF